jgi:hypothetical protein
MGDFHALHSGVAWKITVFGKSSLPVLQNTVCLLLICLLSQLPMTEPQLTATWGLIFKLEEEGNITLLLLLPKLL